jgi:hypothetical protein
VRFLAADSENQADANQCGCDYAGSVHRALSLSSMAVSSNNTKYNAPILLKALMKRLALS